MIGVHGKVSIVGGAESLNWIGPQRDDPWTQQAEVWDPAFPNNKLRNVTYPANSMYWLNSKWYPFIIVLPRGKRADTLRVLRMAEVSPVHATLLCDVSQKAQDASLVCFGPPPCHQATRCGMGTLAASSVGPHTLTATRPTWCSPSSTRWVHCALVPPPAQHQQSLS